MPRRGKNRSGGGGIFARAGQNNSSPTCPILVYALVRNITSMSKALIETAYLRPLSPATTIKILHSSNVLCISKTEIIYVMCATPVVYLV